MTRNSMGEKDDDERSAAAALRNDPTTRDPPLVRMVSPSLRKSLPNLAISSRAALARCTNNLPFWTRCLWISGIDVMAELWLGRLRLLMRYCWKMSVPAERERELGMESLSCLVRFWTLSRVSDTVVEGWAARPRMSDSIAATGIVRSGSEARRRW